MVKLRRPPIKHIYHPVASLKRGRINIFSGLLEFLLFLYYITHQSSIICKYQRVLYSAKENIWLKTYLINSKMHIFPMIASLKSERAQSDEIAIFCISASKLTEWNGRKLQRHYCSTQEMLGRQCFWQNWDRYFIEKQVHQWLWDKKWFSRFRLWMWRNFRNYQFILLIYFHICNTGFMVKIYI